MRDFSPKLMNSYIRSIKQPFIWLRRFRHRRGYGVHSPFAFDVVTNVIYEKTAYYAYAQIEKEEREAARHAGRSAATALCTKKNRLVFRLVNRFQPSLILDIGAASATTRYLQAGNKKARCITITDTPTYETFKAEPVDFIYIRPYNDIALVKRVWERAMLEGMIGTRTVCVLDGIHYTASMKTFWQECINDARVGISFDLYDLGILLFDKSKIKQHYIVNF